MKEGKPPPKPPQLPKPPLMRHLLDSGGSGICAFCGSSLAPKWFWQKKKGCIHPECSNFCGEQRWIPLQK